MSRVLGSVLHFLSSTRYQDSVYPHSSKSTTMHQFSCTSISPPSVLLYIHLTVSGLPTVSRTDYLCSDYTSPQVYHRSSRITRLSLSPPCLYPRSHMYIARSPPSLSHAQHGVHLSLTSSAHSSPSLSQGHLTTHPSHMYCSQSFPELTTTTAS